MADQESLGLRESVVTRELVQRLEAAEAGYTLAKQRALRADEGNARGVELAQVGGTSLLSIQSQRNNPSVNRAMGFAREDLAHLDEMLAWLHARSAYFWFDVAPALADDAVLKALADAGLYPSFFLDVVYARPQELPERAPDGVAVRQVDLGQEARDFTRAFSLGFGIPLDLLERTKQSARVEHGAPGWRCYLATVAGEPAAMATLYAEGQIAEIDAMATAPAYRRRGCQSALLRRCLADAARAGSTLIASQAEPSSGSERNFCRAGFQIAYTKLLYAPRKPGRTPHVPCGQRRTDDDGRREEIPG